jgi:DNA-binding transcriptional ArsR family regulator
MQIGLLAKAMRATGDESRLRLLRLCADGPASVSQLAAALGDSEPNVSRQLKQLAQAGLVGRERRGQSVEYSLDGASPAVRALAHPLLAALDDDDAQLRKARAVLEAAGTQAAAGSGGVRRRASGPAAADDARGTNVAVESEQRFGRALAAALARDGAAPPPGRVLVLGEPRSEPLEWIGAPNAFSRRSAVRNRGGRFDAVWIDHTSGPPFVRLPAIARELAVARRALADGGCVWIAVDYDVLEARAPAYEQPLQRLRSLLVGAGFSCASLVPVEAGGRHALLARSGPTRPKPASASAGDA